MAAVAPHLTKSKFLAGRHCPKRLWLSRHEPGSARPLTPAERSILDAGSEIGCLARRLFPGGVLVEAGPAEHAAAAEKTRKLLAEPAVPAIFEAAFEFENVRVRVDILERIGPDAWGLREVKGSARVKPPHIEDVAIQAFVVSGCGLDVVSLEVIHVNTAYERHGADVAWDEFFTRSDVSHAVAARAGVLRGQVADLLGVVAGSRPNVEPGLHCRARHLCEFWEHCTRGKADDWVLRLPRLTRKQFETLAEAGIERIGDIPEDFRLQRPQQHVLELRRGGADFVHHGLADALQGSGPPADYLDFEIASPAVPVYDRTHPFQGIPFQWSLHRVDADGALRHSEFLAGGERDPRRAFAESLLDATSGRRDPIIVYSAFESRVLENLANDFRDLRDPLLEVRARLFDLLPVVRNCTYHADFDGSFSIKRVAPALVPGFGYADLDGIAEGGAAASAFERIAAASLPADEVAKRREELLAYCRTDTLALVHVHRALRERVSSNG
jgi:hypothetical protein